MRDEDNKSLKTVNPPTRKRSDFDEAFEETFRFLLDNCYKGDMKYQLRRELHSNKHIAEMADHMQAVVYSGKQPGAPHPIKPKPETPHGMPPKKKTPIEIEMENRQADCEKRLAWYTHLEGKWLVDPMDNLSFNLYLALVPGMRKEINRLFNKYKHKLLQKRYPPLEGEKTLGFTGPTASAIVQTEQAKYLWRYGLTLVEGTDEYASFAKDLNEAFWRVYGQDITNVGGYFSKSNGYQSIKTFYSKKYVESPYFGFVMPYLSTKYRENHLILSVNQAQSKAIYTEQRAYMQRDSYFYFFKPSYDWDAHQDEWLASYEKYAKAYQLGTKNPLWSWLEEPAAFNQTNTDDQKMREVSQFLFEWGVQHNVNLRELAYDMQNNCPQNDRRMAARGSQMLKDDAALPMLLTIQVLMTEIGRYRELYLKSQQDFKLTDKDTKKLHIEQKKKAPQYQKTIKELKSANGRLKKENDVLAQENEKLAAKNFNLSEEIKELKTSNQSLRQQVKDIGEQIKTPEVDIQDMMIDRLIPVMWPKNRSEGEKLKQIIEICADPEKIKYQFSFTQKFIKDIVKVTDFRRKRSIISKMIERLETTEMEAVQNTLHDEMIWGSQGKNTRQFRVSQRPASQRIMYQYGPNGEMVFSKYKIYSQHDELI